MREQHSPGRSPISVAVLSIIALVLASVPASASDVAPRSVADHARSLPKGPDALIGTIGFRSADPDHLGVYVTTGSDSKALKARPGVKPYLYEMGLFRASKGRIKLLADNGLWVGITSKGRAKASRDTWSRAWSFKLIDLPQAAKIDTQAQSELQAAGIGFDLPVCIKAFKKVKGAGVVYQGLLTLDHKGRLALDPDGVCGQDTAAMFITDDRPEGSDPALVRAEPTSPVDAVTQVRFVPPDWDYQPLTAGQRATIRNSINTYFLKVRTDLAAVKSDVHNEIQDISSLLQVSAFVLPGETEPEGLGVADFMIGTVSSLLRMVPVAGTAASAALTTTWTISTTGIPLGGDEDLEGPRVVESVTNAVVESQVELTDEVDQVFDRARNNLTDMHVRIISDCPNEAGCVSDRRLAKWQALENAEDFYPVDTDDEADWMFKAYQTEAYRRLLPITTALYQVDRHLVSCNSGNDRPRKTWELISWYRSEIDAHPDAILATTAWSEAQPWEPFTNECEHYEFPWWVTVHRPFLKLFALGVRSDDPSAYTPMPPRVLGDLFTPIDPVDPGAPGLGFSTMDVVGLIRNTTVLGSWWGCYTDSCDNEARYWYDPLQFYFYELGPAGPPLTRDAGWQNPAADYYCIFPPSGGCESADWAYYQNRSTATAVWIPDPLELSEGRSIDDPDLLSWRYPRLRYGHCGEADVAATDGFGPEQTVFFFNAAAHPVTILRIETDGTRTEMGSPLAVWTPQKYGPVAVDPDAPNVLQITARRGEVFEARNASTGACLGTYMVETIPDGSLVDASVAEIHGPDALFTP